MPSRVFDGHGFDFAEEILEGVDLLFREAEVAALDRSCDPGDGGCAVEKGAHGELDPELLAKSSDRLDGEQRVAAQLEKVVIDADAFRSKSKNTPFEDRPVQGRAMLTVVGGNIVHRLNGA